MKKLLLIGFIALICVSAFAGGGKDKSTVDRLDLSIRETSDYLNANLKAGIKLAFVNIQSDFPVFSEYIIDELIANTVNDRLFTVVDRSQLDQIRAELDFQMSGEVDDKTAQELGRLAGAQTIVTGNLTKIGSTYRLRVRALNVQSAQIEGQHNTNIPDTQLVKDLVAASASARPAAPAAHASSGTQATATQQAAQPAAPIATYKVGDTGPAGGIIFYDKGNNAGGWRYLEAAPVEAEFSNVQWSVSQYTAVDGTQETLGSGKRNTELIVQKFTNTSGEWDTAAQKCADLNFGGYNDWYLPSKAELDQIYGQLKRRNWGDFKDGTYWTSSHSSSSNARAHSQYFGDGRMGTEWKHNRFFVRPIRSFTVQ